MSHTWIIDSLRKESIANPADKAALQTLMDEAEQSKYTRIGWDRWICLITAKQKTVHEKSKGAKHQLQPPIVVIPDHALTR